MRAVTARALEPGATLPTANLECKNRAAAARCASFAPYRLVNDIVVAVASAEVAGAMIAHAPMEIPGHGTFAIYFLGGNEHGLWQN